MNFVSLSVDIRRAWVVRAGAASDPPPNRGAQADGHGCRGVDGGGCAGRGNYMKMNDIMYR